MRGTLRFALLGATACCALLFALAARPEDPVVPTCGNNILEFPEECDDGNLENGDGCRDDCTAEVCGDGIQDPQEQCDDGNNDAGDGCGPSCLPEECGNGFLDPGEECDDGNLENGDGCRDNCTEEICGDGILDPQEQCDDGNNVPNDGCNALCELEGCGNGAIDAGETCDPPGSAGCDCCTPHPTMVGCSNADCETVVCEIDSFCCSTGWDQVCADIATLFPECLTCCDAICNVTCTYCGDGNVDAGEACDDGNTEAGDGCGPACLFEECGNGFVDPGEECDDGNQEIGDGCRPDCTEEVCGDGIEDPQEQCDDGNTDAGDGCSPTCLLEECGNGILDPGEECDDGNTSAGDGCAPDCTIENCGDGIVDPNEECDDGANGLLSDGCTPSCRQFCTKPVTEILNLANSGIAAPVRLVIDNVADWCAFWDAAHADQSTPPPCDASLVDFASEIVFAGALGPQPDDCHRATIGCAERVAATGDVRVVLVQELPGPGCTCNDVVVQPAVAAKVALPVGGTRIFYEEVEVDCP